MRSRNPLLGFPAPGRVLIASSDSSRLELKVGIEDRFTKARRADSTHEEGLIGFLAFLFFSEFVFS